MTDPQSKELRFLLNEPAFWFLGGYFIGLAIDLVSHHV